MPVTQVIRQIIEIDVDARKTSKQLQRMDANMQKTAKSAQTMANAMRMAIGGLGIYAGHQVIGGLIEMSDTFTEMTGRLRLVTGSMDEARAAQAQLADMSERTFTNMTALSTLYTRMGIAVDGLGYEHEQLAAVTEVVANTFRISGATAEETRSVITQLSQAMGAGRLAGDELRSVLENNARLSKIFAEALGVPIGRLKELGEQGKITTELMVEAAVTMRDQIAREAESIPISFGRALTVLESRITEFVGVMTSPTEGVTAGANAVLAVADAFEYLADNAAQIMSELQQTFAPFVELFDTILEGLTSINSAIEDTFGVDLIAGLTDVKGAFDDIQRLLTEDIENLKLFATEIGVEMGYAAEWLRNLWGELTLDWETMTTKMAWLWQALMQSLREFSVNFFSWFADNAINRLVSPLETVAGIMDETILRFSDFEISPAIEDAGERLRGLNDLKAQSREENEALIASEEAYIAAVDAENAAIGRSMAAMVAAGQLKDEMLEAAKEEMALNIEMAAIERDFAELDAQYEDQMRDKTAIILESTGALGKQGKAMEDAGKKTTKAAKAVEDMDKALNSLMDALFPAEKLLEDYNANLGVLDQALATGTISQERFNEAVARLTDEYQDDLGRLSNDTEQEMGQVAEIFRRAAESIYDEWTDLWVDLFSGSESSLQDFGDRIKDWFINLLAEMAALATARTILIPIATSVGGLLGVSGDALGQVIGSLGGSGPSAAAGVTGLAGGALEKLTGVSLSHVAGIGVAEALSAFGVSTGVATGIGAAVMSVLPVLGVAAAAFGAFGSGLFGDKTPQRTQFIMTPWEDPAGARMFEDAVFSAAEKAGWTFGAGGKSHGIDAEQLRGVFESFAATADVIAELVGPEVVAEIDKNIEQINNQMKGVGLAIDTDNVEQAFMHFFGQITQMAHDTGDVMGIAVRAAYDRAQGDAQQFLEYIEAWAQLLGAAEDRVEQFRDVNEEIAEDFKWRFENALEASQGAIEDFAIPAAQLIAGADALLAFTDALNPEVIDRFAHHMLVAFDEIGDQAEVFDDVVVAISLGLEAFSRLSDRIPLVADSVDWLVEKFTEGEYSLDDFATALDNAVAGIEQLTEFADADIVEDFTAAWRDNNETMYQTIRRLDDEISRLNWTTLDTLDSIAKAGEMVKDRYELELQLLDFIDGALKSITESAAAAREEILLSNASDAQKYEFYRAEANRYTELLETAQDPELIKEYYDNALDYAMRAFNVLPPEMQAQEQVGFLGFIDYLEELSVKQLEQAQKDTLTQLAVSQRQVEALLGIKSANENMARSLADVATLSSETLASARASQEHAYITSQRVTTAVVQNEKTLVELRAIGRNTSSYAA